MLRNRQNACVAAGFTSVFRRRRSFHLSAGLLAAAAALAMAVPAGAKPRVKSVSLENRKSNQLPVFLVTFDPETRRWTVSGDRVFFNVMVRVRTGGGAPTYVGLYFLGRARQADEKAVTYKYGARRLNQGLRFTARGNDTGYNAAKAIDLCRRHNPVQPFTVKLRMRLDFRVRVRAGAHTFGRYKIQDFSRSLEAIVHCFVKPAYRTGEASGATRNKPFKVTGVRMEVSKFGRECPRRVFVKVTMQGNKAGSARYAVMIGRRTPQARVMRLTWQGGKRYGASFAHQFRVPRSGVITVWVRHKGKRVSGLRRVRVNCSRPFQPSTPVIH